MNNTGGGKNESIERLNTDSLYLLVSKDRTKFKIGIANHVPSRIASLRSSGSEFDLEDSLVFDSASIRMKSVERTLHFLFNEFNITHESNFDGHTEWFNMTCFDAVVEQIEHIAKLKSEPIAMQRVGDIPARPQFQKAQETESTTSTEVIEKLRARNAESMSMLQNAVERLSGAKITYIPGDDIESGRLAITGTSAIRGAIKDLTASNLYFRDGVGWIFPEMSGMQNSDTIDVTFRVAEDLLNDKTSLSECKEIIDMVKKFLDEHSIELGSVTNH